MQQESNNSEEAFKLMSTARFALKQSDVRERLHVLKEQACIDDQQLKQIVDEDNLLRIKFRTRKRSVRQLILSILLISFGLAGTGIVSFLVFIGFILFISAFFGILFNRVTKEQINYLLH